MNKGSKRELLIDIAVLAEKAYRRGVQHGLRFANEFSLKDSDEVVTTWRFNRTLHTDLTLPVGDEVDYGLGIGIFERMDIELNEGSFHGELRKFFEDNKPPK